MISPRIKKLVLERDGYVCQLNLVGCTYTSTDADHRANGGHGGSPQLNNTVNLVASCRLCNGRKETLVGDALSEIKRRGLRLVHARTTQETLDHAADTHVQYRDGLWYRLDTAGHRQIIRKVNRA